VEIDAQIGERMKAERKRLGLSQQQVADAIGVRREMWAKYEAGAEPGAKALRGIALAGGDLAFILTGESLDERLDTSERVLLDSYRVCPSEARQNLLQTAVLLAAGVAPPTDKKAVRTKVKVSADGGYAAGRDMTFGGNPKELGSEETAKGRKPARSRSRA